MKKICLVPIIAIAFLFASCSSSKEVPGVWVNKEKIKGKTFSNVFIIVLTADIQARVKLEGDLVNAVTARGYKAVKSIDLMPVDIHNPKVPSKEEIIEKIKSSGCDAVLAAALIRQSDKVKNETTQAGTTQVAYYSNNYYGYFTTLAPMVAEESYFTQEKQYFMQSNLFDAASTEIMWSVQSEVFNPSNLEAFSRTYIQTLGAQLDTHKKMNK